MKYWGGAASSADISCNSRRISSKSCGAGRHLAHHAKNLMHRVASRVVYQARHLVHQARWGFYVLLRHFWGRGLLLGGIPSAVGFPAAARPHHFWSTSCRPWCIIVFRDAISRWINPCACFLLPKKSPRAFGNSFIKRMQAFQGRLFAKRTFSIFVSYMFFNCRCVNKKSARWD